MNPNNNLKKATISIILIGIGLGGFIDGIFLHQILQWHNMLSSTFPPNTMENMQINMNWDGFFHAGDLLITTVGIFLFATVAQQGIKLPNLRWFTGLLLMGWGIFNLVEGIIDHHLLGIHHVKYTPNKAWEHPSLAWDIGFLLIGGVGFIALGWLMSRLENSESVEVKPE